MNCRLCSSSAVEEVYSTTQLNPFFNCAGQQFDILMHYYQCKDCGFIFQVNHFNEEQYSLYYKGHAPNNFTDSNQLELFRQRLSVFDDVFAKKRHGLVVEVGGGNGDFMSMISAEKKIIIDPSEQAQQFAAENYKDIIYYNSLSEFEKDFCLRCADVLILCHVLEHIAHPLEFLMSCLGFVKEGGAVFIEIPSLNAFVSTKKTPCFPNLDIEHVNVFSNQNLVYLLEKAGCALEFIRTDTSTHFPIVQCVARKKYPAAQSLEFFKQHVNLERKRFCAYNSEIKKIVDKGGKVLFWGCGRKLYQIFQHVSADYQNEILANVYFFDKNDKKSGCLFCGKKILTNHELELVKDEITHVVITAESVTTALAITNEAHCKFPEQTIICITEDVVIM